METTRPQRGALLTGTAALLLLVPLCSYWETVFHRFGFRDDYSILREAREEPGKILKVCSSQGRILYGWLLEMSARMAGDIEGLCWMRLASVVCLGVLASAVFLLLIRAGWHLAPAALLAAFMPLTPSAQVLSSWAICWPHALALVLATAAFALADQGMRPGSGRLRQVGGWLGAGVLVAAATLTYQSNSLFYVVLVAATLVVRRADTFKGSVRWMVRHLCVVGAGLGAAFAVSQLTFAAHVFTASPRMRFETHWVSKAIWTVTNVLPDALALSALDGARGAAAVGYWLMVLGAVGVLSAGTVMEYRRVGPAGAGRWLLGMVALSGVAYSVSFLAAERWPTYRTIYALTGVWSVFIAASLVNIGSLLPERGRKAAIGLLAGVVLTGALVARWHSFELFAVPQGLELQLMEEGVRKAVLAKRPRIFVITATQDDSSAPRRYRDEFGSVSIDSEWVAKEVLKSLMKERFSGTADVSKLYQFAAGPKVPEPKSYDILIDMRRMRQARP
ncbi:hypothetical protein [Stigmatella aurantiaca]|uniref:Conserved uncharacterized protein n=1 Tax=Stigmatella aurantiaca (strain DW4/3-1) TaxID=378806 RepID=Q09CI4_STIAD|nr:hypothetical protein [Stigmatella aurantiaca]ADO69635.1 conserved uncharacterized protein [Stigmatella aurantiaca DW4/3-1]EAU69454.1 hypothetical protein STIAU_3653 [Stigmatella aurantiaca DW4/3-1]